MSINEMLEELRRGFSRAPGGIGRLRPPVSASASSPVIEESLVHGTPSSTSVSQISSQTTISQEDSVPAVSSTPRAFLKPVRSFAPITNFAIPAVGPSFIAPGAAAAQTASQGLPTIMPRVIAPTLPRFMRPAFSTPSIIPSLRTSTSSLATSHVSPSMEDLGPSSKRPRFTTPQDLFMMRTPASSASVVATTPNISPRVEEPTPPSHDLPRESSLSPPMKRARIPTPPHQNSEDEAPLFHNLDTSWSNQILGLYMSVEGEPVSLAQVINMKRRKSYNPLLLRRRADLLPDPTPPIQGLGKNGLNISEACAQFEVPLIERTQRVPMPAITRVMELASNVATMRDIERLHGATNYDETITDIIFSTGDYNDNSLIFPVFKQSRSNRGYDKNIWRTLTFFCSISGNPTLIADQEQCKAFMAYGFNICSNFFLGPGTVAGSIGRIRKGIDVNRLTHAGQGFECRISTLFTHSEVLAIMGSVMPYAPHGLDIETVNPNYVAEHPTATAHDGQTYTLLGVAAGAHSGPPWNGKTLKTNTLLQDLAQTLKVYNMYCDERKLHEDASFFLSTQEFLEMRMCHIKAKDEVQNFHDCYYKKNRNIFPFNTVGSTLLYAFQRCAHRNPLNFLNDDESKLLWGIPICTHGMHGIITKMVQQCRSEGRSVTFYADNIHIMENSNGGIDYLSIDLSSEEARHTTLTALLTLQHIIMSVFHAIDEDGNDICSIDREFSEFIEEIMPSTLIDCIGIMDDEQIVMPGMPSGCPLTFDINCTATAPAVHMMLQCDIPLINEDGNCSEALDNIMRMCGLPYKTELSSPHTNSNSIENSINNPMTTTNDGTVMPLCMLGFDAIRLSLEGDGPQDSDNIDIFIPVLAEERYHKMFWFNKSPTEDDDDMEPVSRLRTLRNQIMKYSCAYLLLGGFLPSRSSSTLAVISRSVHEIKMMIGEDASAEQVTGVDPISSAANANAIAKALTAMGLDQETTDNTVGAIKECATNGLINLGSVIKVIGGVGELDKLRNLCRRFPSKYPSGLINDSTMANNDDNDNP